MYDQINLFDIDILRDYDLQSSSDKQVNGKLITYFKHHICHFQETLVI